MKLFITGTFSFFLGMVITHTVYMEKVSVESSAYLAAQSYYVGCMEQIDNHEVCNKGANRIFIFVLNK